MFRSEPFRKSVAGATPKQTRIDIQPYAISMSLSLPYGVTEKLTTATEVPY